MEKNGNTPGAKVIELLASFPCVFNLASVKKPRHSRLRHLLQKFEEKIELQEEDFEGEIVMILNVMCWIYFQFGEINKAKEKNDESLEKYPQSLMSLGNQMYLNCYPNADVSTYQQQIEKWQKKKSEFENEILNAKAAQAYFLRRLGGEYNLSTCVQLFTELTQRRPGNYTWKYIQGLASRRAKNIRGDKDTKRSEDIFLDIAENSKDANLKSLAFSELAALFARDNSVSLRQVELQIRKALSLNFENARVFINCGVALKLRNHTQALYFLEQALSFKPNSPSHHALGKYYGNYRIKKNKNRSECERLAIYHYKQAFEVSFGSFVCSLSHLAFFYRKRKMFQECEEQCRTLSKCWSFENVLNKPFTVAKVYENMNHAMRGINEEYDGDDLSDRYLSMALMTSLELFKQKISKKDKCSLFHKIIDVDAPLIKFKSDKATFYLFVLFNWCRNPRSARQILAQLIRDGRLGKTEIEAEIDQLLAEGRADQALLILDILDLKDDHVPGVSEELERQVTLEEAKWELSNGQIACKLLFHRTFNKSYLGRQVSSPNDEDELEHRGAADVIILYDAPQWKLFFHGEGEKPREDTESMQKYFIFEDVLYHIFDLEVISNPWMPLTVDSRVDEEFFALVQHNNIKLILLLTDEKTSDQFLQLADSVLGPILAETTSAVAAMSTGTTSDVAIISCDGKDCSEKLPSLGDARHFDAYENGILRRWEYQASDDFSGTEIIDAFFSGKVENAMNFFNFLAPFSSKH